MAVNAPNLEAATFSEAGLNNTRQAIIGGSNTNVLSDNTQVIGPSNNTVTLNPSSGKLFLKDNPVSIKTRVTKNAIGIITANELSNGIVSLQAAGAYTLDTTVNICNRFYDSSGTAFVGSPGPMFEVTFHNTSGGAATINSGTGQTFTNVASISIPSGNSTTVKFWFTSTTTMNVESISAGGGGITSLTSAGGTVSLVNDGTGPALANKGLTAGTGISMVDGGNQVTITNSSPASSVTLSNAAAPGVGEAGLVVDGTGPTLSIKKLVAGANVILTNNVNDVTIAAAGGGGITEPLFTSNRRAIISGLTNNFTNVNANSYGAVIGGTLNTITIPVNSGALCIGGTGNTCTFNAGSIGSIIVAGSGTVNGSTNTVLIGGANTTMGGVSGSLCVGSSTLTTTLNPNTRKTFIKDSPVYIKENTAIVVVGVISAAEITRGVVEFQTAGAYTFDTTVNIRDALLDATGAAFVGDIRPYFRLTLYNTSGFTVTINPGAGQTFTNNATIRVRTGSSRTINWWFTSNTTMIVEDLVSFLNDGVGTSLVRTADGPEMEVKGINVGTGLSVSSNTTTVTITNTDLGSSVTLTSAGGTSLITDGTGPTLAIKGILTSAGMVLTNNPTNLTIGPQALYGIYQYQVADGLSGAAVVAGTRNLVPLNTTQSQNGMTRVGTTLTLSTAGRWYISGKIIVRDGADRATAYITSVGGGAVLLNGLTIDNTGGASLQMITSVDGVLTSVGATTFELRVYTNNNATYGNPNNEALGIQEAYANLTCLFLGA